MINDLPQVEVSSDALQLIITASGALDLRNSDEFHRELVQASGSEKDVTVDFRTASFIDTAILQYLSTAAMAMIRGGKRLKLIASESGYPYRALKTAGFAEIIDIITESTSP